MKIFEKLVLKFCEESYRDCSGNCFKGSFKSNLRNFCRDPADDDSVRNSSTDSCRNFYRYFARNFHKFFQIFHKKTGGVLEVISEGISKEFLERLSEGIV